MNNIKSRIVDHVKIRAGDLVPHELNPREHTDEQRDALRALYEEIGFARSLLGYRLPDGRIKLIDGHLRQSMDEDMEVDVEVLDVNDEEARKLLLSLDPLAALAGYNEEALASLREATETANNTLAAMWAGLHKAAEAATESIKREVRKKKQAIPESFAVLVSCANEKDQITLLRKLKKEGLDCKAITT